ncbi:MAG: MerR family transcriptional regulator [Neisseriaceae bacterium]|nr:MerR family transcriptional regulator [Neisseriaceae bacterium]MBP6861214.1 MerR family transcriptional regulator [Neisseriaceae bacterium]
MKQPSDDVPQKVAAPLMTAEGYEGFLSSIIVGATEVAKITGLDARKLRYWQEKGVIEAHKHSGTMKQYDLKTVKKIILIQELIEDGYTLDGAAIKVNKRLAKINDVLELISLRILPPER